MSASRIIPTMGRTNCGGRCRLLVEVQDDRILSIKGDPHYPEKAPCIRGLNYHKTFLGPDRLQTPLRRVGKRGEGKFEPITWQQAIEIITAEWIRIRDTYGPASRYVHYGWGVEALLNGTNLAKRLLRLDGGHLDYYNSYSTACTNFTTPYLYGTEHSGSTYNTLLDSKLIILWAHNPAETRFDDLMHWPRKAKQQGTTIVVIDPRRSATVDALGAEWIGLRPSTDAAMMDAMAYVIWSEDLYDHDFVTQRCLGFDRYFAYLSGAEDGIPKTPQWAQQITGVDAAVITDLARRYALAKPAALMQGYGGQRHANGEQFARGGVMLACLTGNVGVRGGWAAGAGQCHTVDFPGLEPLTNPVAAKIPVFTWTDAVAKWDSFTPQQGLQGAQTLETGIKMILNLAGNALINQHSDINRTKQILQDESLCEFIVCSDLFLTPSAMFADILLPATSMLETDNITTPWNQGSFLGFCNKVVPPVGQSRFEFDWLLEIARNLGVAEQFSCGCPDADTLLRKIYEEGRTPQMPDYDAFKQQGIYLWPDPPTVVAFEAQRRGEVPFATPSGKVEIYSPTLESLRHPLIPAVPGYVPAAEGPGQSEEYPLQLIGWHTLGRCHSIHFNNPELAARYPQQLWMNPADAAARGLRSGNLARVYNARGALVAPVLLTEAIVPGVTALAQGAWYRPDAHGVEQNASINVLTSLQPTPLAKGNPQHTNLVQVQKHPLPEK